MKQTMMNFATRAGLGYVVVILICMVLMPSCGDQQSSGEQDPLRALEAEVMRIHDDVMPRTKEINALIVQLDSMGQHVALDTAARTKVEMSRAALVEADSLMWAWMYGYSAPSRDGDTTEIRRYLENEKVKISEVSEKMHASIDWAQQVIKRLTPNEKQ